MSSTKTIYYAVGIYRGGGLTILKNFFKYKKDSFFYLDYRIDPIHYTNIKNYKLIKPRFLNILFLQYFLSKKNNSFFFINGIPPIFKFRQKIYVLFQNSNIIPNSNFFYFIQWLASKDFLRFLIFFFCKDKVDCWVVISDTARFILVKYVKIYVPIIQLLIFDLNNNNNNNKNKRVYDFIYPADYKKHKNHKNLILAFLKLAKKGIKPSILFTLTNDELAKIDFKNLRDKINVYNFSNYNNRKSFLKLLRRSKSLIYPSLNETLGIPIIEAYENKLNIITSNLPYAKQYVTPNYTFDPFSVSSISRAISKYYLKEYVIDKKKIFNTNHFLTRNIFFNSFLK